MCLVFPVDSVPWHGVNSGSVQSEPSGVNRITPINSHHTRGIDHLLHPCVNEHFCSVFLGTAEADQTDKGLNFSGIIPDEPKMFKVCCQDPGFPWKHSHVSTSTQRYSEQPAPLMRLLEEDVDTHEADLGLHTNTDTTQSHRRRRPLPASHHFRTCLISTGIPRPPVNQPGLFSP